MEWPSETAQDGALAPHLAKDGRHSQTPEQFILTVIPTLVVAILSPFYLRQYYSQPVRVLSDRLLSAKMTIVGCLLAAELISCGAGHYMPSAQASERSAASASPCVAALLIGLVIRAEHRRSLRSSSLPSIYLLVSTLADLAKIRTYHCQASTWVLIGLSIATAAIKLVLLFFLEASKRSSLAHTETRNSIGDEFSSGFWGRSFFLWLNGTMLLGFRSIITVDDLDSLGPDFSPETLSDALYQGLREAKKPSRYVLLKSCITTFETEAFSPVLPRLCLMCFKFTQPIFLRHIVAFIAGQSDSLAVKVVLMVTSLLIFLGIALSRATYNHATSHFVTMLRGAIIPMVIQKSLVLPSEVVKESAALTLMSTDIDGIASGIPQFHLFWSSILEVSLAVYMLNEELEDSAYYVLVPLLASTAISFGIGKFLSQANSSWKAAIQKRVARTTQALLQMKSLKMIGLEQAMSNTIQRLRIDEIACFKHMTFLSSLLNTISAAAYVFTPIVAIGAGFFWSPSPGLLTPIKAFTTLAIVALIIHPLMAILNSSAKLQSSIASFNRIETYLLASELNSEQNCDSDGNPLLLKDVEPETEGVAIEFDRAFIAPSLESLPIFCNTSFSVESSCITAVLGPVGSGKTTLLRAMAREAPILGGRVRRKDGNIAYCGQQAWLRNTSIRTNIVGPKPFDPVWYEVVVNCCALNADFRRLPGGDSYIVGINGGRLSGGQKLRVALARALYEKAAVVVLDDIFRGLDTATAEDVHNRLFGEKGVLRRSATTVVFATHSETFMRTAHQALILNGSGAISVQPNASAIVLSKTYIEQLAQRENSVDVAVHNAESATNDPVSLGLPLEGSSEQSRQRGDLTLYRYFTRLTSSWKICLWLLSVAMLVGTERSPEVFVRIWLEFHVADDRFFMIYASIGASTLIISIICLWLYYQNIVPDNALKLHQSLLDSVMGAPISFLTSTEMGSIISRFSQDMTALTWNLPMAFFNVAYFTMYAIYDASIIISGLKYAAALAPFLIMLVYIIQAYYLRTSRQLRHLDAEAKTPLYTLFTEMATGLEHIRAFGWQSTFITEITQALNDSQKPYFYMMTVERWLELAIDFSSLGLAVVLVCVTTIYKESTSEAAMGLTMLNLVTFGTILNVTVVAWGTLETAMAAVSRLRQFIHSSPTETGEAEVELPARWPQTGNIMLYNVTARYRPTDRNAVLNNISLRIDDEDKVGISGRTGSGKTSILSVILRLIEYTGTITIDGIDISTIPPRQLRSRITTIAQDTIDLGGTIRENILPYEGQLEDETIFDELVFEALDKVELTELVESRGGLDVALSAMGLSEGEMQLLAFARAIMHNTCTQSKVVLLDEPTSSMDTETDNRIQGIMQEEFLGCTIVIVSHRTETLWDASKLLEVRNGNIFELPIPERPADEDSD